MLNGSYSNTKRQRQKQNGNLVIDAKAESRLRLVELDEFPLCSCDKCFIFGRTLIIAEFHELQIWMDWIPSHIGLVSLIALGQGQLGLISRD